MPLPILVFILCSGFVVLADCKRDDVLFNLWENCGELSVPCFLFPWHLSWGRRHAIYRSEDDPAATTPLCRALAPTHGLSSTYVGTVYHRSHGRRKQGTLSPNLSRGRAMWGLEGQDQTSTMWRTQYVPPATLDEMRPGRRERVSHIRGM